ncbi:MAG: hypothetical protein NTU94_17255 [Planctomycetota bacterium]|nr:hypothetical protein [Planctomycetota bacterium]
MNNRVLWMWHGGLAPPWRTHADSPTAGRAGRATLLLLALAAAALAAGGCQGLAWVLVKTVGPWVPEDTVEAEYKLEGKSLLVLVDVKDPSMAAEYPRLDAELADQVGKRLQAEKACGPVVPGRNVQTARRTEPEFPRWSVTQVGQYFNVDVVMHVEVMEYRLKDSAGSNVFRGYAETSIRLVSPETGEQVWPVLAAARLLSAETMPDQTSDEAAQQERILTEGLAEKIARHFFTYKKNDLPLRPKVK